MWFSTWAMILALARWPSKLRDRSPWPSTRFRREKVHSAALRRRLLPGGVTLGGVVGLQPGAVLGGRALLRS